MKKIAQQIAERNQKAIRQYMKQLAAAKDMLMCKYLLETDIPAKYLAIYQQPLKGGGMKIFIDLKDNPTFLNQKD